MNDIVLNKKESIERCIRQIRTYYALPGDVPFAEDYLRQDAIALNLQRACEQCIDLANHTIRVRKLGLPKESRESFRLLAEGGIIHRDLASRLEGMVGFRNVLVHQYQKMDINLMIDVIENRLDDLVEFTNLIASQFFGDAAP
ncbi:DUF86 domain-containing protein [Geobacter sp.]|uniref:type VII toxin-antitoxin system HepT family RNase toxin n=1 Tax=Geobacter sp. TaxID=46610 RepID=UPI002631737E|nr:DUF86 domain-containing protein [Geobacter sp.]